MLEMHLKPGKYADLVQHFQDERIFDRALESEGCREVTMLQGDDKAIVLGWWDDADAYQRWIDNPERHNGSDRLNELLTVPISPESVGGLFDVALSTAARPRDFDE